MTLKEKATALDQLRYLRREVDMLSQRIAELELAARGGAGRVTGLSRSVVRRDGMGDGAARLAALAEQLDARRARCMEALGALYDFIDGVADSRMRMLGLGQSAVLYRRTGFAGGKPVYAASGEAFPCRAEPAQSANAAGQRQDGAWVVRIYAPDVGAAPGDRVALADGVAVVSEVKRFPGPGGVHHVELTARGEGGGHG